MAEIDSLPNAYDDSGLDSYDEELARIEASIADIKTRDLTAARERTRIAAKIQAAQFQRDILSHANQQRARNAKRTRTVRRDAKEPKSRAMSAQPTRQQLALLSLVAALLPVTSRMRYLEEWLGELYDLRAEGAPWWRCVGYIAGIVAGAAPSLAVVLRRSGRRAVD